jgi:hypothetical protein
MLRIILGVVAGFAVWSILWVGSDFLLTIVSPGWWGKNLTEMEAAVNNRTAFMIDSAILVCSLLRSVVCSLLAGFIAASIARENSRSTLILGVLLLAFGIYVQSIFWHVAPLWYHFLFLFLLMPVTIIGGKMRKPAAPRMWAIET